MIKLTFNIIIALIALSGYGQDITGQWNGILKVQGIQLRLVINITETDSGYKSTLDSPDQGARDIPVTLTSFEDSMLHFEVSALKLSYSGSLNNDGIIQGTFKQMGQTLPLNFSKEAVEKEKLIRPQHPTKPYPYYSEEVTFINPIDSISLSGTLTLPTKAGKYPVVVLITGSGPQNRDEEILGHKPFLVIADHLTKKGIGVLRFDDRGTAKSTGDFKSATTKDLATDVLSAITFLKTRHDIDYKNIGLIGHSAGGLMAPMIASESEDIAFIVLLAGPGISGYDILLQQTALIARANGADESKLQKEITLLQGELDIVVKGNNLDEIKLELSHFLQKELKNQPELVPEGINIDQYISGSIDKLATPWFQYFLKYDPATSLIKVRCPVLAINGEKDLQVPSKVNLNAIKKHLKQGGNHDFKTKELANLNHLFQECVTGSPNEYAQIEQTFSPTALLEISNWVATKVK
ncbi:alpha/beta hydrolase family protein [Algibacter mikhailovii]|uniref:alpha/beta hydrolase family protein n=1 Tax=Algibacter mikhailovii TaxID=425498 RepID=UPI002493D634|nr:alpha/beta fold hydrolase [Algibacter mikhailovii]